MIRNPKVSLYIDHYTFDVSDMQNFFLCVIELCYTSPFFVNYLYWHLAHLVFVCNYEYSDYK